MLLIILLSHGGMLQWFCFYWCFKNKKLLLNVLGSYHCSICKALYSANFIGCFYKLSILKKRSNVYFYLGQHFFYII